MAPTDATVTLTAGAAGTLTSTAQKFTATGVVFGETKDVSAMVGWFVDLKGVNVDGNGIATATAPGIYTITAKSGNLQASATLTASVLGRDLRSGLQPDQQQQDRARRRPRRGPPPSPTRLDHALFPSNLSPIYAQMAAPGANSIARLNFQATGLDINYYANCVATDDTNNNDPLPGTGCYVKMPLTLTQLFIATSERQDIKMTARVLERRPRRSSRSRSTWPGRTSACRAASTTGRRSRTRPKATMENAPATPPNYILLDPTATNGHRDLPLRLHQRDAGADGHLDRRRRPEERRRPTRARPRP